MSHSYTVKGSMANQRGARRTNYPGIEGRPGQQPGQHGVDGEDIASAQQDTQPEDRYQRREAYTVIRPNEDKRAKLIQIQQKEEETARLRKEMKGKTPIRLPPKRVGGPRVSHEDVIAQQQRQTDKSQTQKSIEMREKRERWKQEKKDIEDKEIAERKTAARLQAEKNEKRASLHKETVRSHWATKYSEQSGSSYSEPDDDEYTGGGQESFYTTFPRGRRSQRNDDLAELCEIYPEYQASILEEILQAQGSVEGVQQLLG